PPGRSLLLGPSHARTRGAVPVAAVAAPADEHLTPTSFAAEDPAVSGRHPQAPTKGFTGGRGPAMLYAGASTTSLALTQGVRVLAGPPPFAVGAEAISRSRQARNSSYQPPQADSDPMVSCLTCESAG